MRMSELVIEKEGQITKPTLTSKDENLCFIFTCRPLKWGLKRFRMPSQKNRARCFENSFASDVDSSYRTGAGYLA